MLDTLTPREMLLNVWVPVGIGLAFLLVQWLGPRALLVTRRGLTAARLKGIDDKLAEISGDVDRTALQACLSFANARMILGVGLVGIGAFCFLIIGEAASVRLLRSLTYAVVGNGAGRAIGAFLLADYYSDALIRPTWLRAKLQAQRAKLVGAQPAPRLPADDGG